MSSLTMIDPSDYSLTNTYVLGRCSRFVYLGLDSFTKKMPTVSKISALAIAGVYGLWKLACAVSISVEGIIRGLGDVFYLSQQPGVAKGGQRIARSFLWLFNSQGIALVFILFIQKIFLIMKDPSNCFSIDIERAYKRL